MVACQSYGALWFVAATSQHPSLRFSLLILYPNPNSAQFSFPQPCFPGGTLPNPPRPPSRGGPSRGFASSSSRRNLASSFSATSTSTSSTSNSPREPFSSPISLSMSISSTPRYSCYSRRLFYDGLVGSIEGRYEILINSVLPTPRKEV